MTNFFGTNITDNKRNTGIDGDIFITRTITEEQSLEIEQSLMEQAGFEKKRELPLLLEIVKTICFVFWLLVLGGMISAGDGEPGFAQGYRNAPLLFWIGLLCFLVWLTLFCTEKVRRKKAVNSAAFEHHIETVNALKQKVERSLEIPQDAYEVDVFLERYILKNGEPKHRDFGLVAYLNLPMSAFVRGGNLCLANMERVWEIPLSSFRSVTLEKKRPNFPYWNKSEPIHSEKYKPYKIARNQPGQYFARYYRVEIADPKGEFYLLIPEYDGGIIMELTNLR